jgi:hypothetical protein
MPPRSKSSPKSQSTTSTPDAATSTETQRVARDVPSRDAPVRNANAVGATSRGTTTTTHAAGSSHVAEQAVGTAYRVLDEYVDQGRKVAEQYMGTFGDPSKSGFGGAFPTTMGNFGLPGAFASTGMRAMNEMMKLWMTAFYTPMGMAATGDAFDTGRSATPGEVGAAAMKGAKPTGSAAATGATKHTGFTQEIASPKLTSVTLDLDAYSGAVVVNDLVAVDGAGKPPINTVQIEPRNGTWHVQVSVPKDQPDGVYTGGVLKHSDGAALGTVTLRVRSIA